MKKNKIPKNLPTLDLDFEPNPGAESTLEFEPNPGGESNLDFEPNPGNESNLDFEPNPGNESNPDLEPNPQSPQVDGPKAVFRDPDNPETVINPPFTFEED